MRSTTLPTQGPIHNVKLLDSGGAQLGMIMMGAGLQGWNGTGDWTNGKQFRKMRALFPMYDTPFQAMVLRRSGITTLAQLDKKRIGVGPRAGTGGTYSPAIFKVLGISAEINYGSFDTIATELFSGRLDAFVTLSGAPVPAIQEAEAKEPVTFISLSPEQIEAIRKAHAGAQPLKDRGWDLPLPRERTMSPSECIILRSGKPISRTIWSTNWSKRSSRTSRAF